jgi:midasin
VLSRAFRNRFVELHVDDIPETELETILAQRCSIPPSYCKKLVAVMKDLQRHRQGTRVFAGKHGYITLRDLFRWAERRPNGYQELAEEGYLLLGERLRRDDEKEVIRAALEKHLPRVKLSEDELYERDFKEAMGRLLAMEPNSSSSSKSGSSTNMEETNFGMEIDIEERRALFKSVVWTRSMKRLFTIVGRCLKYKEPVLLVGETGCGKTSICQFFARMLGQHLHILNCHQHTETADFLGGLRPVRGKDALRQNLMNGLSRFLQTAADRSASVQSYYASVSFDPNNVAPTKISDLMRIFNKALGLLQADAPTAEKEKEVADQLVDWSAQATEVQDLHARYLALFAWYDGPLVQSMKRGDLFLIDEISLAEDSVLERLNSVLEPHRLLVLAEKGATEIEELVAHEEFRIMATMNPGGDFGKKELSPAMRNRFTEVWVPPISSSRSDLALIVDEKFVPQLQNTFTEPLLEFVDWFSNQPSNQKRVVSLRDILSWVTFMNTTHGKLPHLSTWQVYIHGACLVFLDALSYNTGRVEQQSGSGPEVGIASISSNAKHGCFNKLLAQLPKDQRERLDEQLFLAKEILMDNDHASSSTSSTASDNQDNLFSMPQCAFEIAKGPVPVPSDIGFALQAPTTAKNVMRVLRALQLPKPILLEGSPGVRNLR